ncbi:anaerobic C4-dicarboxylate transporter family protein [Escherichia coli]
MLVVELIIVLLAIFLGARLGGIGIGFAGGLGVLVLAAIGVKPGNIPVRCHLHYHGGYRRYFCHAGCWRSGLSGSSDRKAAAP